MIRHPARVISLVFAGLAAFVATASLAQAQDANPYRTSVTFNTASLKTPEGAEAAYRELYKAAQVVCDTQEAGPKWREADDRACERQAVADAVTDLAQPQLYRLNLQFNADPDRLARSQGGASSRRDAK